MENFLEMEKDYENIYVFYEINKKSVLQKELRICMS